MWRSVYVIYLQDRDASWILHQAFANAWNLNSQFLPIYRVSVQLSVSTQDLYIFAVKLYRWVLNSLRRFKTTFGSFEFWQRQVVVCIKWRSNDLQSLPKYGHFVYSFFCIYSISSSQISRQFFRVLWSIQRTGKCSFER